MDYACNMRILEDNLQTANKTSQILKGLTTNTPTLRAMKLHHTPEYSRDRKDLPNIISKVHSKLVGENGYFLDDQNKLHYIYGYHKGNTQN
jgi:hypothetical protein